MIKLFPKNEIYLLNKFHTAKDLKRNVPEGHCSGDIQPLQIRPSELFLFEFGIFIQIAFIAQIGQHICIFNVLCF